MFCFFVNFPVLLSIVSLSAFIISVIFSLMIFGFVVGYRTIYKKVLYDRQKLELTYKVYDKEWLKKLNVMIINLTSNVDSIPLRIYIITPKKNTVTKDIVIYHHGITSSHVAGYKLAKIYLKKNFTFICYDSRGWGDNNYNGFCTYGIYEKIDLLQIVKYFNAKYSVNNIILHGESMGGKTVLEFACNYDYLHYVSGYVIDSGFASLSNVVKYSIKKAFVYIPYRLIYPFTNLYIWFKTSKTLGQNNIIDKVKNIKKPVFIIYSKSDSSVPEYESKKIIDRLNDVKVLYTQNSPHVLTSVFYREKYKKDLDLFLKYVKKKGKNEG